eukprot:COSAG02_NODE_45229_length_359_cov_0.684615_1_plen_89_part_10
MDGFLRQCASRITVGEKLHVLAKEKQKLSDRLQTQIEALQTHAEMEEMQKQPYKARRAPRSTPYPTLSPRTPRFPSDRCTRSCKNPTHP